MSWKLDTKTRNKLKEIMRKAREQYYQDKCMEFRQKTSQLWKLVNKMTNKENDETNLIDYLRVDNIDIYSSKLISEEFAKHFAQVGKTFAEKIPESKLTIEHYLSQIPNNPKTMFMTPTTIMELKRYLCNFQTNIVVDMIIYPTNC